MSEYSEPYAPPTGGPTTESSTPEVARGQAAEVGQHAREAGSQVAQTAADQARQVVAETGRQARDLLGEAQGQARHQASAQQQKAAQQLHSVADELGEMAANDGQSGLAAEFARQAADRMHAAASWLEQREPGDVLDEVRSFARRRPGAFLIGAAVAGLAAGRLTRGLAAKDPKEPGQRQRDAWPASTAGLPAATSVDPAEASGAAYAGTNPVSPYAVADPVDPVGPQYTDEPAGGVDTGYPAVTDPIEPTAPPYPAQQGDPAEAWTVTQNEGSERS